ncbi:PD40 domain-containing protein, partial [bacterium]|nr:PD40 domain-containing protein [bacterium]
MKKRLVVVFLLMLSVLAMANSKHILKVDDLFAMGRVGSPEVSADGKWAAYTVTEYSMADNKSSRDIWLTALDGSGVRQLTQNSAADFSPAWNPTDSNELAFISTRDGSAQIYLMNIKTAEIHQLTTISTGASGPLWSPDGTAIAFVSDVYPELKTDAENATRDAERDASPVKARVIDHLLYRHWNAWKENKRSHVFVADVETGVFQDKTPGDFDSPPISLGGAMDYAFSSNSKTLAFVRNTDPMVAISTNNDVFTVSLTDGVPTRMTPNPALDVNPVYSPNGKYLFYLAMARPAFEADQQDIMRLNLKTGERINLTSNFDRSVNQLLVSPNSKTLYFTAFDYGRDKIYTMPVKGGAVDVLVDEHDNSGIFLTADGKNLVFRRQAANMPHEIFKYNLKKKTVTQLTFTNQERLANLEMNPVEDF